MDSPSLLVTKSPKAERQSINSQKEKLNSKIETDDNLVQELSDGSSVYVT